MNWVNINDTNFTENIEASSWIKYNSNKMLYYLFENRRNIEINKNDIINIRISYTGADYINLNSINISLNIKYNINEC